MGLTAARRALKKKPLATRGPCCQARAGVKTECEAVRDSKRTMDEDCCEQECDDTGEQEHLLGRQVF